MANHSNEFGSTVFRAETWQQNQDVGALELRGDDDGDMELALFVNGKPFIYDAADCDGSVGRFVALLPGNGRLELANRVSQTAKNGFVDEAPLHQQIAPLLELLPIGEYKLTLEHVHPGSQILDWDSREPGTRGASLGYYPYARTKGYDLASILLWTQPDSSLQDEVVNDYLARIERGERSALITIGAHNHLARFILDGHHKMFAYYCVRQSPPMLHIEFQSLRPITWKEADHILSGVDCEAKNYLRHKKQD